MKPFLAIILSLTIGIAIFLVIAYCSENVISFLGLLLGINLTMGACIIHTINKNFSELRKDLKDLVEKDE